MLCSAKCASVIALFNFPDFKDVESVLAGSLILLNPDTIPMTAPAPTKTNNNTPYYTKEYIFELVEPILFIKPIFPVIETIIDLSNVGLYIEAF